MMQLIEGKKLQLTQTIKDVLPGLDIHRAENISLHHLLLHISGLPNESDTIYHHYQSPEEIIRTTTEDTSRYHHFESFHYTNIDYLILGLVIQKVTGQSWQENVQKRIFDPVDMTQSGFAKKDLMPEQNVSGYIIGEEGSTTKEPSYFIENFGAAASIYSTAEDLLKLDQSLYLDVLLKDESKEMMYNSYPEFGYVGYGNWVYQYPFLESQPKIIERRGGLPGFNHVFIRMPELNRTIIVLSNNNLFDTDTFGKLESLKEQLIQIVATKI
jgi:CubicO group peptidase (beta-lactamase class C family)